MIDIRRPTNEQDFDYIAYLWADEDTMAEVGGIHILKKKDYSNFKEKYVNNGYYFTIYNNNIPSGEVSIDSYNTETKVANLNIKIEHSKRHYGIAKEALKIFLDYYFNKMEGCILEDLVSSPSGKSFLRKLNIPEVKVASIHDFSQSMQEFTKKYNVDINECINGNIIYFRITKESYSSLIQGE